MGIKRDRAIIVLDTDILAVTPIPAAFIGVNNDTTASCCNSRANRGRTVNSIGVVTVTASSTDRSAIAHATATWTAVRRSGLAQTEFTVGCLGKLRLTSLLFFELSQTGLFLFGI